jgi:hypothetical protein
MRWRHRAGNDQFGGDRLRSDVVMDRERFV